MILGYVAMIVSVVGLYLNAKKNIACWYILAVANIFWVVYFWDTDTAATLTWFAYFVFNFYGFYQWGKRPGVNARYYSIPHEAPTRTLFYRTQTNGWIWTVHTLTYTNKWVIELHEFNGDTQIALEGRIVYNEVQRDEAEREMKSRANQLAAVKDILEKGER